MSTPDAPDLGTPPAADAAGDAIIGRRVLIAEDEALIRLDLREMLVEEGFEVVGEAGDGEQAIALATELRPDLVICDIKMPKVDGIAAAAHITGERIAPVVMLTAFSQRDLVERARDAGAMAYLVKPFQKRDLLPAIEMAVSRFAEIIALESEVTGLRERLEARKLIERAKGALMTRHSLTEPAAFRWIQRAAMDNRTSMRAVAEVVLADAAESDADTPAAARSDTPRSATGGVGTATVDTAAGSGGPETPTVVPGPPRPPNAGAVDTPGKAAGQDG